jgi:hypothetical protein
MGHISLQVAGDLTGSSSNVLLSRAHEFREQNTPGFRNAQPAAHARVRELAAVGEDLIRRASGAVQRIDA